MKVEFASIASRDQFVKNFRSGLKDEEKNVRPTIFARNDLLKVELQYQAILRRECFERNQRCGQFRFYYRDLQIHKCKPPFRDFVPFRQALGEGSQAQTPPTQREVNRQT